MRGGQRAKMDTYSARALVLDGRGWSNKDRTSAYDSLNPEQLLERLESWSPVVRERAAMAVARRKDFPVPALVKMLGSKSLEPRYGACQALALLRGRGAPAVDALTEALEDDDLWFRVKAAEALASIGKPAMATVPVLLERLALPPSPSPPSRLVSIPKTRLGGGGG